MLFLFILQLLLLISSLFYCRRILLYIIHLLNISCCDFALVFCWVFSFVLNACAINAANLYTDLFFETGILYSVTDLNSKQHNTHLTWKTLIHTHIQTKITLQRVRLLLSKRISQNAISFIRLYIEFCLNIYTIYTHILIQSMNSHLYLFCLLLSIASYCRFVWMLRSFVLRHFYVFVYFMRKRLKLRHIAVSDPNTCFILHLFYCFSFPLFCWCCLYHTAWRNTSA